MAMCAPASGLVWVSGCHDLASSRYAATVWAATDPRCANQAFNIANGDLFRWEEMWPRIAGFFDLDVAPSLPMSLADVMSDKEPAWHDQWQGRQALPLLMRVRVEFPPEDTRAWPDLLIKPFATVDTMCVLTVMTGKCRGRQ